MPVEGREKKTPHRIGFLVVRYLTEEFRVVKGDFNVVSVVRCLDVFPPFSANKNWTSSSRSSGFCKILPSAFLFYVKSGR